MQADMQGLNLCTTLGALALTGAATTHATTVTITYSVGGKGYTKTAITGGTTPTTDYNTGKVFVPMIGGGSVTGAYGTGYYTDSRSARDRDVI